MTPKFAFYFNPGPAGPEGEPGVAGKQFILSALLFARDDFSFTIIDLLRVSNFQLKIKLYC